jgi:uncharacterized membrane protein
VATPSPSEESGPPDWEILIAHHAPHRYGRTIAVRWGRRRYHFCARCSGEALGFLALIVAAALLLSFRDSLATPLVGIVLAIVPSVAWLDWISQTLGRRESTNPLRVVSGVLLGGSLGALIVYGATGRWLYFGAALAVLLAYLVSAAAVLLRSNVWQRVIAEHFP